VKDGQKELGEGGQGNSYLADDHPTFQRRPGEEGTTNLEIHGAARSREDL